MTMDKQTRVAKKEIRTAWRKCRSLERYGLSFGRTCYKWQQKFAEQGQRVEGRGVSPILDKLKIPKSTAYFWIKRYKISVGLEPEPELDRELELQEPSIQIVELAEEAEETSEETSEITVEDIVPEPEEEEPAPEPEAEEPQETEEERAARVLAEELERQNADIEAGGYYVDQAMELMRNIFGPPAVAFIQKLRDCATELENRPAPPVAAPPPNPSVQVLPIPSVRRIEIARRSHLPPEVTP
jgi:hypothetical protein